MTLRERQAANGNSSTPQQLFASHPSSANTMNQNSSNATPEQDGHDVLQQSSSFPFRLHRMLSVDNCAHIVSWLPHGRAWKIFRSVEFEEQIMPCFFCTGRFSSFSRQVRAWGFKEIAHGPDAGAFYHELFQRGMPHLCTRMSIASKPKPILQRRMHPLTYTDTMNPLHTLSETGNDHFQTAAALPTHHQQIHHSFSVHTPPPHRGVQHRPTTGAIERSISNTASIILSPNQGIDTQSTDAIPSDQDDIADESPNSSSNTIPNANPNPTSSSNVIHACLVRSENDPFRVFQERLQQRTELINSLNYIARSQRNDTNQQGSDDESERTIGSRDVTSERNTNGEQTQESVNANGNETFRCRERRSEQQQQQQQQHPLRISLVSDVGISPTELSVALGIVEQMIWMGHIQTDPPSASITISNTEVPMIYHGGEAQPLQSLWSQSLSSNTGGGSDDSGGVAQQPETPEEVSSLSSSLPTVQSSFYPTSSDSQVPRALHHGGSDSAADNIRPDRGSTISSSLARDEQVGDGSSAEQPAS